MAAVSRSTVCQIEEGRTRGVNGSVLRVLADASGTPQEVLTTRFGEWLNGKGARHLDPRAMSALSLPPSVVAKYHSFQQWRQDVAPSPTALASMLKVPRGSIVRFERGEIPMPKAVYKALMHEFGLSEEYVDVLRGLDAKY